MVVAYCKNMAYTEEKIYVGKNNECDKSNVARTRVTYISTRVPLVLICTTALFAVRYLVQIVTKQK